MVVSLSPLLLMVFCYFGGEGLSSFVKFLLLTCVCFCYRAGLDALPGGYQADHGHHVSE